MVNKHIGSKFDDFLSENDLLAEAQAEAIKRVIVWQIKEFIKKERIKKTEFALKMKTSRSQLDRLLDPENTSLNLKTLTHAAEVMGKHVQIKII